jgi:hypothetical protein
MLLLEDYHRIMGRMFAHPDKLESYAGGSITSW